MADAPPSTVMTEEVDSTDSEAERAEDEAARASEDQTPTTVLEWEASLEGLLKDFPTPPTSTPVLDGGSVEVLEGIGAPRLMVKRGSASGGVSMKSAIKKTFFKFCTEPNISLLAVHGDIDVCRNFAVQNPTKVKGHVEHVLAVCEAKNKPRDRTDPRFLGGGGGAGEDMDMGERVGKELLNAGKTAGKFFSTGFSAIGTMFKGTAPSFPVIELDTYNLDFGGESRSGMGNSCKLRTPVTAMLKVRNSGEKATLELKHFPSNVPKDAFRLSFKPQTFALKKGREMEVTISLEVLRGGFQLQEMLVVEVTGRGRQIFPRRQFALLKIRGEKACFGVPVADLDMVSVEGIGNGVDPQATVEVPNVLVLLKEQFLAKNGHKDVEGVFRVAPDDMEVRQVKNQLNMTDQCGTIRDPNVAANLIKIFFRELPVKALDSLNAEDIINKTKTHEDCEKLFLTVPEAERGLVCWALDLLCHVTSYQTANKMTPKNCGIVWGPNMYTVNLEANPMQAVVVSQKVCQFFEKLLQTRMKKKPRAMTEDAVLVDFGDMMSG